MQAWLRGPFHRLRVLVYAVHDLRSSPEHPLGDAVETFIRREDAERFIEAVRGDDPEPRELPEDRGARARGGPAGGQQIIVSKAEAKKLRDQVASSNRRADARCGTSGDTGSRGPEERSLNSPPTPTRNSMSSLASYLRIEEPELEAGGLN
ncbi:MAG TPA: hypothetical protein VJZ25_03715 [Gemmatimonadaceae bacterium]|nr:hypothetical protein [Gemmatimonadaceae bacterium]